MYYEFSIKFEMNYSLMKFNPFAIDDLSPSHVHSALRLTIRIASTVFIEKELFNNSNRHFYRATSTE